MQKLSIFTAAWVLLIAAAVTAPRWLVRSADGQGGAPVSPSATQPQSGSLAPESPAAPPSGVGAALPATAGDGPPITAPDEAVAPVIPPPPQPSKEAEDLIREAKNRLFAYSSVQAKIREYVSLGDRRFEAEGTYLAGPFDPLPKLRVEYHVRVGNTEGRLLEVCDGQILRSMRSIDRVKGAPPALAKEAGPAVQVTRRDVKQILEAVYEAGSSPDAVLKAELGLGGLPALLASLERSMILEAVREDTVGSRTYKAVQGRWTEKFVQQLRVQFEQFGRAPDAFLPSLVRIYLDPETLFPVRVVYWNEVPGRTPPLFPILTLEFSEIRLNEPVPEDAFQFVRPADVAEEDVTVQYIEAIKTGKAAAEAAAATPSAIAPTTPPEAVPSGEARPATPATP